MTGPGALALTGLALAVLAIIFAAYADTLRSNNRERLFRSKVALGLTFLAAVAFIGAAWWEALS